MKIWVIQDHVDWEGKFLVAAFSTREKAEAYLEAARDPGVVTVNAAKSWQVEEQDLDPDPEEIARYG